MGRKLGIYFWTHGYQGVVTTFQRSKPVSGNRPGVSSGWGWGTNWRDINWEGLLEGL